MRLAVISDVHGNAYALEAVLGDVRACAPDVIVNLGDQVTGRADPERAYRLQSELDAVEVLGSAEPRLNDDDPLSRWLRDQLPRAAVERLTRLPAAARVADGDVFACHGAPDDPNGHLFRSWRGGPYLASPADELRAALE